MFVHKDLIKSRVLTNKTDSLPPDPRFYQEVFNYIRSEVIPKMEWPPAPGDLDWYYATDLISDFVTDKINTGTVTLKTIITNAGFDGGLQERYYSEGISSSGRMRGVDVGFYGYRENNKDMMSRILAWLWTLQQTDSSDYYWEFDDFKKPKLVSSMRRTSYDPEIDMDEEDYSSLKGGHALISRLLLRIRDWPHFSSKEFSNEEQKKFMVRTALIKMAGVLKWMLTEGREWSTSRLVDAEQELLFTQGLISASTPKGYKRKRISHDDELATMMVSPISSRKPPKLQRMAPPRKIPERRKLPIKRLNFDGEKSFIAEKYTPTLPELMSENGNSPKDARDQVDFAFSGNQACYTKVEEETGVTVDQLAEYAASESPKSDSGDFQLTRGPDNTLVDSSPDMIEDTRMEEFKRVQRLEKRKEEFEANISMPAGSSENPILIIE